MRLSWTNLAVRRVLPLGMVIVLMMQAKAAWASGFIPDRMSFFQNCSTLTNFTMLGTIAVPHGTNDLTDDMKAAINGLFDVWEREGDTDPKRLAYILATARRESMGTWRPIREAASCGDDETCREKAIGRMLAARAAKNKRPVPPNYALPSANGQRYYGRGYLQLTFETNYERADRFLGTGTTMHDHPDKVMELDLAQTILVRGMLHGWFGSKQPLSLYLDDGRPTDWIYARDNVNPGSPNKPITAESAKEILRCLRPAPAG